MAKPARFMLEPPPGFQGLLEDLPLHITHRHLPHWHQPGATYFVTFRFGDAIPIQQQELLRDLRSDWEKKNPPPRTRHQWEQLNQLVGRESEKWLDVGFGECWMRQPEIRELVANALGYFDLGNETERLSRYELGAFVLMPNHLHLLVRPFCLEVEGDGFPGFETALSHVTHSWKRFTSRKINKLTGLSLIHI